MTLPEKSRSGRGASEVHWATLEETLQSPSSVSCTGALPNQGSSNHCFREDERAELKDNQKGVHVL